MMIAMLVSVLVLWMLAAGWCGWKGTLRGFAAVLVGGLALNTAWLMLGLGASPVNLSFAMAQAAATLYALTAYATGWLIRRIVANGRDDT